MDFGFFEDLLEEKGADKVEVIGEGYRNIWVVAETMAGKLLPATLEAMGQARELADQIGVYVYGVLLRGEGEELGQELVSYGADRVLVVSDPALADYQPEVCVRALADLVGRYRPEIVLMPATALGNDLAPRLAQHLNTGLISHCVKLEMDMSERLLLGTFSVLDGEVYHTVACPEARPQMATLQPGYFRLPYADSYRSGSVQGIDVDLADVTGRLGWGNLSVAVELPPLPLSKARVLVSAGRGMGDASGFALVTRLAEALGGTVAGSRGAFDEGWITEDQIVGIGGQLVAPDLYIACGISGDVYHYFGLQNAKFVVAINRDPEAPIMKVANMAVVGEARQVLPAMLKALGH
jgi:electron transfer flavoprotein alpha subunit